MTFKERMDRAQREAEAHPTSDPNWRAKALAGLDPLSPEAFGIRKARLTLAERADLRARGRL